LIVNLSGFWLLEVMGGRSIARPRIYSQCEIQWISRHENEFSSRRYLCLIKLTNS
jgi:hypothetical protein